MVRFWKEKYLKPRTIIVKYQINASTNREFRDAYNKMNFLLSGEQVKIYFNEKLTNILSVLKLQMMKWMVAQIM